MVLCVQDIREGIYRLVSNGRSQAGKGRKEVVSTSLHQHWTRKEILDSELQECPPSNMWGKVQRGLMQDSKTPFSTSASEQDTPILQITPITVNAFGRPY